MAETKDVHTREQHLDAANFFEEARLGVPPKSAAPPVRGQEQMRRRIPVFERAYHYRGSLARGAFRAFDLVGETLLGARRERPSPIRRVLLMRPDHVGDLVCTLPAIHAVRESLPDAHVDLLVRSSARVLFAEAEKVAGADFLLFNAAWRDRPGRKKFALRSAARLVWLLRVRAREIGGPYDLAVDFAGDFQSILAARLAGVRYLVGRGIRGGGFALDAEAEETPRRHQVELNLAMLERAGLGAFDTTNPSLALTEEECEQGRARVAALVGDESRALIGIHPGAGARDRVWNPALYGRLIERVASSIPVRVLLLGGPEDRAVVDEVLGSINDPLVRSGVVDACEKVRGLRALMGVMKACRLYVGNDAGPTHVAAALGLRVVCIFQGPAEPSVWGPRGPNVMVLRKRPAPPGVAGAEEERRELDRVYEAVRRCV